MGPTLGRDDVELIQRDTLYQGFFRLEALELRHRLFEGGWSATMRREVHNRFDAVGVLLYDRTVMPWYSSNSFALGQLTTRPPPGN